ASNIIIGYNEDAPTATTSNHLNIGGVIYGDLSNDRVGIGLAAPDAKLHVQAYEAGKYTLQVSTSSTAGHYSIAVSSEGLTNVNNLVIENRTSDPVSPVTGQIWLRVD
ncbi:MAG: hypothetical protein KAI33_06895, partial [Elusimicrobiales bacterium]|nr:hypothetical protein [Elusimicrobiales bacterium]